MSNFGRAVRMALRYKWTFFSSIVCALAVAVLWGGNISAVYPFVEVAFKGQSMQEWVDTNIATAEKEIAAQQVLLAELQGKTDSHSLKEISLAQTRLAAEEKALGHYHTVKPWIEALLPNDPFQTLVVITGVLLAGTIIKGLFLIANTVLVDRLALLATFDLRKQFFRRTLRMDVASFGEENSAELMSRFTYDLDGISGGLRALFGKFVREPLKMVACLIGAGIICWRLLVLSLVVAPIAGVLIARLAKLLKRANRKAMEEMSQIYGILEESLQGIKIVKAFTMERYERRRFHAGTKKYYAKGMRIAWYDALTRPVTEVMGISTICLALLAGAYLVLNHETHLLGIRMSDRPLSLSTLLVFYGLLAGISDPFRKMTEVLTRLQRGSAAADRVFHTLDREPTVKNPPKPQEIGRHRKELKVDNVRFSYGNNVEVLSGIDLTIPFGETLAIVGPNGCGKSTLLNLLPRFYDPTHGAVKLDGVDLRNARVNDLRRQIGLVTQETLLFDDSVYNNIRYGTPHATREDVIKASQQAHAHKFIEEKLENGYDSVVGERGSSLSGGQRQRIALARAILRDPPILLLDEATSQIDLESEQLIHRVLEQFIRNRTTIIVTHRMSTLALADRIVVMEAGKILDVGTHEQLLRRCGLYNRLHEIQFKEIA